MKKASVIALIVGAAILLAGIITCIVGLNMAKSRGIPLYETNFNDDGDLEVKYDLGQYANKNSLDLTFKDAKVEIRYTEEESSYILLKNFANYTYSFVSNGSSLAIDNTSLNPLSSFQSITKGNFDFKGLRFFGRMHTFDEKEQRAVVYLNANKIKEISSLSVRLDKGSVFIGKFPDGIMKFDIKIGEGSLLVQKTHASSLNVNIDKGDVTCFKTKANNESITVKEGNVTAELTPGSKLTAEVPNGTFTLDGKETESPYTAAYGKAGDTKMEFILKVENGNADLSKTAYTKPKTDTEETKTAETDNKK